MATRGLIGFIKDGVLTASYNHYDSYESGLGKSLNTFFNTPEKAEEIANMGDIRYVNDENGEVELFPNAKRATKLNLSKLDPDDGAMEVAMLVDSFGADYAYFYDQNNKWVVIKNRGIRGMIDPQIDGVPSIKDILYSDFENEDNRMSQSDIELEEYFVRQMKQRAGIIK
jgi:hypothetical protein